MKNIEEMHKACIILDLINAPKMQIVFCPKEKFEERYGFVVPTKGDFHWMSIDDKPDGRKIDVIATIRVADYSFVFIDPSQLINKQQPT